MDNKTIVIQGAQFDVSQPFDEGHVCTQAEAKALNQTRSENIRNNFAKKVKLAKELEDAAEQTAAMKELKSDLKKYDADYVFTIGGTGAAKLDPIEREARKIARAAISAQLQASGRKISELDKDKLADAIATVAERDEVIKAAKKAVAEKEKLAGAVLEGLEI